jgi:hypothetical protein
LNAAFGTAVALSIAVHFSGIVHRTDELAHIVAAQPTFSSTAKCKTRNDQQAEATRVLEWQLVGCAPVNSIKHRTQDSEL